MSASESPAACPPPLMWHDVRREYLEQCTERIICSAVVRTLGHGPPLYLLPGFSTPAELFCLLIWLLRDDFRCVTIDPAGDSTSVNRNLQCEVDQLLAVADEMHDDRFSIFGVDYGSAWGLAAACARPERISRLILLQAFAHRRISFLERRLAWLAKWSGKKLTAMPLRAVIQTQNHRRWFPPFDETRWQYFLDASGAMPVSELACRARAIINYDLRAELPQMTTPILLIRTEGDGGISERCISELEHGLPAAKTEWLHNTGHLAYLTHPHRLAKLVREFAANRE